jgi:threonine/homoserine/homoserine lactone efflux protein
MEANIVLKGLIIGFSIAAPVGPIGVLCIRRTLLQGRIAGFLSGLGAASADALYGCVAGFGLTFMANFLLDQQLWFSLIGGAFLGYLGVKTFFSQTSETATTVHRASWLGAYGSTFLLTLTNPATILSFAAIFAGLGLANSSHNYLEATLLVLGVFAGSALWWLLLSGGVSLFRTRLTPAWLGWVNRISGVIIAGFGLVILLSLLA